MVRINHGIVVLCLACVSIVKGHETDSNRWLRVLENPTDRNDSDLSSMASDTDLVSVTSATDLAFVTSSSATQRELPVKNKKAKAPKKAKSSKGGGNSDIPSSPPSTGKEACEDVNDCSVGTNRGMDGVTDGDFKDAVKSFLKNGNTVAAERYGGKISCWDVSRVTDMSSAFFFRGSDRFNDPLCWDVSSVENMGNMFDEAVAFNQDISSWDVSSVTNMEGMFEGATAFNQDISSWDVSSVEDMRLMFFQASAFNQPISSWNVSSVENMQLMFRNARAFDQDISSWDVSSVEHMQLMFRAALVFNQNISSWDVSSVQGMSDMFNGATAFNQNLCVWAVKTPLLSDVADMFEETDCPQKGSPTVGTNTNPRPGPFCHECMP
eukprot:scaffold55991_cov37-Attheya_sp.AAC.2